MEGGGSHQQLGDNNSIPAPPTPVLSSAPTAVIDEHSMVREARPSISQSQSGQPLRGTEGEASASMHSAMALQPQAEPAPAPVNLSAERPAPGGVALHDVRPQVDMNEVR
jgi:hypothetical protein